MFSKTLGLGFKIQDLICQEQVLVLILTRFSNQDKSWSLSPKQSVVLLKFDLFHNSDLTMLTSIVSKPIKVGVVVIFVFVKKIMPKKILIQKQIMSKKNYRPEQTCK